TPTPGPPRSTTAAERTSTGTPPTSWSPSSPAANDPPQPTLSGTCVTVPGYRRGHCWSAPCRDSTTPGAISETSFVPTIRRATAGDGAFLQEMLAIAADWRPDTRV